MDPYRVTRSGAHVEAIEIAAEPSRFDPHDRVDLRIEAPVPSEDVHRDRDALQPFVPPGERFLDEIAQELPPAIARLEGPAGANPFKFFPHLVHTRTG
jgi:hypothetical protein